MSYMKMIRLRKRLRENQKRINELDHPLPIGPLTVVSEPRSFPDFPCGGPIGMRSEQLESLPVGAEVRSYLGNVFRKFGDGRWYVRGVWGVFDKRSSYGSGELPSIEMRML